jgi:hypothetical protein
MEISDAESLAETNPERRRECEKPLFKRDKKFEPTAGWWRYTCFKASYSHCPYFVL